MWQPLLVNAVNMLSVPWHEELRFTYSHIGRKPAEVIIAATSDEGDRPISFNGCRFHGQAVVQTTACDVTIDMIGWRYNAETEKLTHDGHFMLVNGLFRCQSCVCRAPGPVYTRMRHNANMLLMVRVALPCSLVDEEEWQLVTRATSDLDEMD